MSKIPAINAMSSTASKIKTTAKTTLPVVGGCMILSGSSMGPTLPPNDDRYVHTPGSSVTDPFIDQVKHTGAMIKDAGEDIYNGVKEGAKDAWEHLGDFLDDIF